MLVVALLCLVSIATFDVGIQVGQLDAVCTFLQDSVEALIGERKGNSELRCSIKLMLYLRPCLYLIFKCQLCSLWPLATLHKTGLDLRSVGKQNMNCDIMCNQILPYISNAISQNSTTVRSTTCKSFIHPGSVTLS